MLNDKLLLVLTLAPTVTLGLCVNKAADNNLRSLPFTMDADHHLIILNGDCSSTHRVFFQTFQANGVASDK